MAMAAAAVVAMAYGGPLEPVAATTVILLAYAVPVTALELLVRRVHRNHSTGLCWSRAPAPDVTRVLLKLLGLSATVVFFAALHIFFRVYDIETLRATGTFALLYLPILACATVGYVYAVDGRQQNPFDAYWELGAMLSGRVPLGLTPSLRSHIIGWAVKAFFLPIMLYSLMANTTHIDGIADSFAAGAIEIALGLLVVGAILDVTVAVVGYTLTCRLFDAHIRSPNGYLAGWVVTLACYYPFNEIVIDRIIAFQNDLAWDDVILDHPLLFWPWLLAILTVWGLHLWCKFVYGLRFSNLTHRGIVTGGPYRYTKHPDYVTKSVYFWLTAAPFLTAADGWTAVTSTVALVTVNLIYFGRARTEEWHLSEDPVYVRYARAMNERSIFRGVAAVVPALRYVAPGGEREAARAVPFAPMTPGE
jgi:protein-S-isoprenylcysteine O-methyltransferase Ste14